MVGKFNLMSYFFLGSFARLVGQTFCLQPFFLSLVKYFQTHKCLHFDVGQYRKVVAILSY